jgi:hypothetical protein
MRSPPLTDPASVAPVTVATPPRRRPVQSRCHAFAVVGDVTATFAIFFVGRDAANGEAELAALPLSKGEGVLAVPSSPEGARGR